MILTTAMADIITNIAPRQNLKPGEIVYLKHVAGMRTDKTDDTRFWRESFGISCRKAVSAFLKNRYIHRENRDGPSGYREIYVLTEKGKNILTDNEHILYIADLNLESYLDLAERIKRKKPELNKYDIACRIMEHRLGSYMEKSDWRAYRNCLVAISSVFEEKGDYAKSLPLLFRVCKMDMSRLDKQSMNKFSCSLADGIVSHIDMALCKMGLSDNEAYKIYSCTDIPDGISTFYRDEEIWDEINMRIREYCYVS